MTLLGAPHNDRDCLENLTAYLAAQLDRKELLELAERFASPVAIATWIRSLPQLDDTGDPSEVPRVACDVAQRVQLPSEHPNCVERALLYIALAEQLDTRPVRQLATVMTPGGRHTFATENGRPVVLEPKRRRSELAAELWRNAAAPAVWVDERTELAWLLGWILDIAEEPARDRDNVIGVERVKVTRAFFRQLGLLVEPRRQREPRIPDGLALTSLRYTLARAREGSTYWGAEGRNSVALAHDTLAGLGLLPCGCRACSHRNASAREIGQGILGVSHTIGGTFLRAYGLGGLADSLGEVYEREGWIKPSKPPPSAPPAAQATGASSRPPAIATATATVQLTQTNGPSGERGNLLVSLSDFQ